MIPPDLDRVATLPCYGQECSVFRAVYDRVLLRCVTFKRVHLGRRDDRGGGGCGFEADGQDRAGPGRCRSGRPGQRRVVDDVRLIRVDCLVRIALCGGRLRCLLVSRCELAQHVKRIR